MYNHAELKKTKKKTSQASLYRNLIRWLAFASISLALTLHVSAIVTQGSSKSRVYFEHTLLHPLVSRRFTARRCHLKIAPCRHLDAQLAMTEAIVGPSWLRRGVEEKEEEEEREVFGAKNRKKTEALLR